VVRPFSFVCFAAAFTAVGVTGNGQSTSDWLIVPGKRIGPVTGGATRADLVRFFGAKRVDDDYVSTGRDTEPEVGTIVNGDDPGAELHILWNEDKPEPHVAFVAICPGAADVSAGCRWHTAEGITIGTTLKALEKLNAGPFKLMGMGSDRGGVVVSFSGGRLERLRPLRGCIGLQLEEGAGEPTPERAAWLDQIEADREFLSSHPAMQRINPNVQWMTFSFEPCEETGPPHPSQ